MTDDDYLTTSEVAELLDIHPVSVRRKARNGDLPAMKLGRDWFYPRTELEQADERARACAA